MTMTAAERRAEERAAFDASLPDCPSRQLLAMIGSRWRVWILNTLGSADGQSARYSEIARAIAGVSPKMLAQTLREMERDGLLTRTVTASVPVRVDYALTPLGETLLDVVRPMKRWAEEHMGEVLVARTAYDTRLDES